MDAEGCVKNDEKMELTSEEHAVMIELVNEAQSHLTGTTENKAMISLVAGNETTEIAYLGANLLDARRNVLCLLKSFTGGMNLHAQIDWAGKYIKIPPQELRPTLGAFRQTPGAEIEKGCKGAVVYAGKNAAGDDCGWLLAWSYSLGATKKVYVECGPLSQFDNINWDKVEQNLDSEGASSSTCTDPSTETKMQCSFLDPGRYIIDPVRSSDFIMLVALFKRTTS